MSKINYLLISVGTRLNKKNIFVTIFIKRIPGRISTYSILSSIIH